MKTTPCLLAVTSLLLCACGEKAARQPARGTPPAPDAIRLTTDLPPELIEGTPKPLHLPLATPAANNPAAVPPPGVPRPPQFQPPPLESHARSMIAAAQPPPVDRERYGEWVDNIWQTTVDAPLSTFSIDVDTASYTNMRGIIRDGRSIPRDALRLEEMVNYFDYDYAPPTGDVPFALHLANATCPWNPHHQLVRVALKGAVIERRQRPPANLVYLIDVSGSMNDPRKLPLVTAGLELLVEELGEADSLAIIVYAGAEGLALPATACDAAGRAAVTRALRGLSAGGTTNGGAGINLAYQTARDHFKPGGINRVILATDGDFNVGVTGDGDLVRLVAQQAKDHIDLSVIGVGTGNLNDAMLEAITNKGNGTCYYLDSIEEARRIFVRKTLGTLATIAKDVKIQVEFNPAQVKGYRLLGYANRMLRKEDFANDAIDAGDIGSGHAVTAFYEIEPGDGRQTPPVVPLRYAPAPENPTPVTAAAPASPEWLTVKLRYKQPEGTQSRYLEQPYTGNPRDLATADADFRFAAAVAMTAMALRADETVKSLQLDNLRAFAAEALGSDPHGQRREFVDLLDHLAGRTIR